DPVPGFTLERPSALKESLDVLPGATLPLRVLVRDRYYAARSVWLEYRCSAAEPFRRVPLYGPGLAAKDLLTAPLQWPGLGRATPRPPPLARPLGRARLRHADGSPPREGDVITFRVCADDFDDVTPGKGPGRTPDVDLRVVSRPALEAALSKEEARLQQELAE